MHLAILIHSSFAFIIILPTHNSPAPLHLLIFFLFFLSFFPAPAVTVSLIIGVMLSLLSHFCACSLASVTLSFSNPHRYGTRTIPYCLLTSIILILYKYIHNTFVPHLFAPCSFSLAFLLPLLLHIVVCVDLTLAPYRYLPNYLLFSPFIIFISNPFTLFFF